MNKLKNLKVGDKVEILINFTQKAGFDGFISCNKGDKGIIVDELNEQYLVEVGDHYSNAETFGYFSEDQLRKIN